MRYKIFGAIKYNHKYQFIAEYENDQIIHLHYCNKINSSTNDVYLLKKQYCSFNYLNCTFSDSTGKYIIEYASNLELSDGNYCTTYGWQEMSKLDQNMDVIKGFGE